MNNNDTNTTTSATEVKAASDRRLAELRATTFVMPDRKADRSRNGRRAPGSRPRRNHW